MNVSRYCNTKTVECSIEFLSPAFLGGANQSAELRTAPFKAALRWWWRVAQGPVETGKLWERECALFGAANSKGSTASKVRLRLTSEPGGVSSSAPLPLLFPQRTVFHPEAQNKVVPVEVYLGMGPVSFKREYNRSYIEPGKKCTLVIEYANLTGDEKASLSMALYYMALFGTIGSRSRNGWGSFAMSGLPDGNGIELSDFAALMNDGRKYPHGFGKDTRFLAWETEPQKTWIDVFQALAENYIKLRTECPGMKLNAKMTNERGNIAHTGALPRHLLGYPLTNHKINDRSWGERLASPLLFSVKKKNGSLVGRIVHLPYSVHMKFEGSQKQVWENVHRFLDAQASLHRMGVSA